MQYTVTQETPAAIFLSILSGYRVILLQCAKSICSIRSEAGGTFKLESVLGRQRLHYSEDIEKQSIKQKDNSVNGEPLYKT